MTGSEDGVRPLVDHVREDIMSVMTSLSVASSPQGTGLLYSYLGLTGPADSLVNSIVLSLARDIIEGRMPPGTALDSLSLARRFGASRTPIREALVSLQSHELLDIEPNKRARVSGLSDQQITEIYELRAELHAIAARKVASIATDRDLDEFRDRVRVMRQAVANGDVDTYFWGNVDFHELAAEVADDSTLKRVVFGLGLQVLRLRHAGMAVPGQMERSLGDHERLVRAFAEHDEALAAALGRTLVLRSLAALRTGR